MKESAGSFALRRLQEDFRRPRFQIIMATIIVILGLSGPFGTVDVMRLGPRMTYWAFVAISTYAIGSFTGGFVFRSLQGRNLPAWVSPVVIALLTGVVISAYIVGLNMVVFEDPPDGFDYYSTLIRDVMIVAMAIALAMHFLVRLPQERAAAALPPPPPLLDRLELDKRGDLILISVQDHYVEVVTTRGTSLILLRMGDAIRETGETPGLQVHRSHWVATDHVTSVERDGARATLTMTDGRKVPVSRTYVPALREAGLLPNSAGQQATGA